MELVLRRAHRTVEEVGRTLLEEVRRCKGVVAAEARHTGLVVGRRIGLGERGTVAAVGMDYASLRQMGPGEVDMLAVAVGDNPGVAGLGNFEVAVEGSLGAVEDSPDAVVVDIDPAVDNLEVGPRSPAAVEDILVGDIGSAEVAGSHLKSASKLLWRDSVGGLVLRGGPP